nr:hypothetical protein [Escherichia coli]
MYFIFRHLSCSVWPAGSAGHLVQLLNYLKFFFKQNRVLMGTGF